MMRLALLALAVTLLACVPAHAKGHRAADAAPASVPADADRIASALEAANAHAQAPEQRQDAQRTLAAAEGATRWAGWTVVVAGVDTAITLFGVVLVGLTLREAKRTADATIKAAQAAKDAAEAALAALDRPWLFIEELWNIDSAPAPDKELKYARIKVTNYGKMPAVVGTAKAVLFYSPGLFLADAFKNVVNPMPKTMREFPGKSQAGMFVYSNGKDALEEDKDIKAEPGKSFGKLNKIPFDAGFVIAPGKTQEFFFRGDATIDVVYENAIPVEHAASVFLFGNIIYAMPTDEVEILTFCYEAKLGGPFRAYGGPPYNDRKRVRRETADRPTT
jgi:hypothetical protein